MLKPLCLKSVLFLTAFFFLAFPNMPVARPINLSLVLLQTLLSFFRLQALIRLAKVLHNELYRLAREMALAVLATLHPCAR